MTTAKFKRSQFATFLNTTPAATATYALIGDGVTNSEISYNPQTEEVINIHQDSGTTEITAYKPSLAIEATAINEDSVFESVDGLRKNRAVLDASKTDIVNGWMYETATGTDPNFKYPAEKQEVYVAVESFGGEGGQSAKINYSLYYAGDPVTGYFIPYSKTWSLT